MLADYNQRRAAIHRLTDEYFFPVFERSRQLAARLIHAGPDEIALTHDTSYGINVAARSLRLQAGDIVVTSDREFPANVYPWLLLEDIGVTTELVPVTDRGFPDEERLLARLEDPRVKVLAISLVQFSNGYKIDLARFSAATRAAGKYLVVDAIQALGQEPVDIRTTPVDLMACGAQKWLLSPWGSGFLYVRRELIERAEPALYRVDGFRRDGRLHPPHRLRPDSAGRCPPVRDDHAPVPGLCRDEQFPGAAAGSRGRADPDHLRRLHQPVLDWAARRGVAITSPVGSSGSGILCVAPGDPPAAYRALHDAGIIASLREGAIRLSPHLYNSVAEMERLTALL